MAWEPPVIGSRPIVILGAGVLGRRIASTFVAGGYNVHMVDFSADTRKAATEYITDNLDQYVTLTPSPDRKESGTYASFENMNDAIKNAWLVIEAIPEKLKLKMDVFGELDQKAPADCLLGSNSSSYKSSLMLDKVSPERRALIFNIHYMIPPLNMVVELMTDGQTEAQVFPFMSKVLTECGMLPATAKKESTGFIFNRLWAAIKREILRILAEGVSEPAQIDSMFKHMFRAEIVPCKLMDQIGLDTVAFIEDNYIQERNLDGTLTVDWLRENYLKHGKLGDKSDKGGFYLNQDGQTANGHQKADKLALYALDVGMGGNLDSLDKLGTTGKVLRVDPATGHQAEILTNLSLPDGIDVSESEGRLFWTNMGRNVSIRDGSVMSSKLDGTDVQTLVPEGKVHTPKQLVVANKQRKVYFCDREGMGVHRCDFDGKNHEVLAQRHSETLDLTQWCVGIAVDEDNGKVYWTQKGPSKAGQGRIFRANLEIPRGETASNRSDIELLSSGLPEPIDLELDAGENVLYWTDRGEHPRGCSLNRASLADGSNLTPEIVARHFNEPIGLKLDSAQRQGYVADLGGSLYKVDLATKEKRVVYRGDACYTGIALGKMDG